MSTRTAPAAFVVAFGLATSVVGGPAVGAQSLRVYVDDVPSAAGHVLVAVCTEATFLGASCPYTAKAPAQAGTVRVELAGIAPGVYAVQAFHDANDNIDLDRTLLGFPEEAMGFSRDAPMRFGPPRFADAAVAIDAAETEVRFTLRQFGPEKNATGR